MRWSKIALQAAVLFIALYSLGCAAVFRGTKEHVRIESDPVGADAYRGDRVFAQTPTEVEVERQGTSAVHLSKQGFEDHRGVVKKSLNVGWLTWDIISCVIPIALCIPILVDAISGGWMDVETTYHAKLKPGGPPPATTIAGPPPTATTPAPAPTTPPAPTMSESEKKATARAAYIEGVQLQEQGKMAEALARFESAEQLYSAPTHLLHLGQCRAATGKLVEAQEDYEKLARYPLDKNAPDAFRQAVEEGKVALPKIRSRVPTLRISLTPPAGSLSSLVVKLNSKQVPNEVVGIARPVNPGTYKIAVWAAGYKEVNTQVEVAEGATKAVDLQLSK